MTIQQEIELSQLRTIEEMIDFDRRYKIYLREQRELKVDLNNQVVLNNGRTAVITKYHSDFQKWIAKNTKYPNPVHISCEDDIEGDYFFVCKATNYNRVFNYKKVASICKNLICLKVAIIGNFKIDAIRYNKSRPKYKAVDIYDMQTAKSHYYVEVVCTKSAHLLGGKIYVEKLVTVCNARLVYMSK